MSTLKADMTLAQLDRISLTLADAAEVLKMRSGPINTNRGLYSARELLFHAARDRAWLPLLLDNVPEPPEDVQHTSRARYIGPISEASKARVASELSGEAPARPRKGKAKA